MWTATTSDGFQELAGGIVTAKESWNLFRSCVSVDDLDCSSYEYYIAQLCYALHVEDATSMIDEMKRKYNMTTDAALNEAATSLVESLAVSLVALARAMTLLNMHDKGAAVANNALDAANTAKRLLQSTTSEYSSVHATGSTGGIEIEYYLRMVCDLTVAITNVALLSRFVREAWVEEGKQQ